MRPIKLTMSAFGPYAGKEVVELDKLGKTGIYLITGKTGAGKSTIFDGIMFCLYGVASGSVRKTQDMRSSFADAKTETYAELLFEHAGKRYTVRRRPEYDYRNEAGDLAHKASEVRLTDPDGNEYTKKTDVNAVVKEVVGLEAEQFRGIAMIAQGDFDKVIHESTKERQEIFRKLFGTVKYNELAYRLKQEAAALGNDRKKLEDRIRTILGPVAAPEESGLEEALEKAKEETVEPDGILELLEEISGKDKEERDALKKAIAQQKERLRDLSEETGRISELRKSAESLQEHEEARKEKLEERKNAKAALEEEKGRDRERKDLSERITLLRDDLTKYDGLDSAAEELERASQTLKDAEDAKGEAETRIRDFERETKRLRERAESIEDQTDALAALAKEEENRKSDLSAAEEYRDTRKDLERAAKDYEDAENAYREAREQEKQARETYNDLNIRFLDDMAGYIAEELEDGKPCPVCGSTEHPHAAARKEDAPDRKQVDKAKEESERAAEKMREKSGEASGRKERKEGLEKKKQGILEKRPDLAELEDPASYYRNELEDVRRRSGEAADKAKEKQELLRNLKEAEPEGKTLQEGFDQAGEDTRQAELSYEKKKAAYDLVRKGLKYESRKKAEDALAGMQNDLAASERKLEKAEDALTGIEKELEGLDGMIRADREKAEGYDEAEAQAKEAELQALTEEGEALDGRMNRIASRIDADQAALTGVRECASALGKIDEKYGMTDDLARTATGDLVGCERIALETYVQAAYLDRILTCANRNLLDMTQGRYELARCKASGDRRSTGGLDLDVIDHINSTRRSVTSISGGESFEASLSLALGLSEEISREAGGIRLDTLFVDEGFGSLDEETLSTAMKALNRLSESDRLVGVISHVGELRQRIEKKIVVTVDREGASHTKIEV